jgi:hypothetical protein
MNIRFAKPELRLSRPKKPKPEALTPAQAERTRALAQTLAASKPAAAHTTGNQAARRVVGPNDVDDFKLTAAAASLGFAKPTAAQRKLLRENIFTTMPIARLRMMLRDVA